MFRVKEADMAEMLANFAFIFGWYGRDVWQYEVMVQLI